MSALERGHNGENATMDVTFSWSFPALKVANSDGGFENVVQTVHWRLHATNGDYTCETYGSAALPSPGQPFVDYNQLTPAVIQAWVEEVIGLEELSAIKAGLVGNIEVQQNSASRQVSPPWM